MSQLATHDSPAQAPLKGRFSSAARDMLEEDVLRLLSVGVDIGSSTSHLVFSRLHLAREGTRYVVIRREVVARSAIALTPYLDQKTIDGEALGRFVDEAYTAAGLTREDVDTGALILTGVALRRRNARSIAELFARDAGRFVSVSAGDELEALLAARGSGAAALSAQRGETILNVDIGGGTAKLAVCEAGAVRSVAAVDIGARLVAVDEEGRIVRMEESVLPFARSAGVVLEAGEVANPEDLRGLAAVMADRLMNVITGRPLEAEDRALFRTAPLVRPEKVDAVTFSGGVAEFIYKRESRTFGDLGPLLAEELLARLEKAGVQVRELPAGIRATVVGASQYTLQLSGSTILVEPASTLPLRNMPVLAPPLPLAQEGWTADSIAALVRAELGRLHRRSTESPVALAIRWEGSATYARIDAFCRGVVAGMEPMLRDGLPLVLLFDSDVGGVFGLHLRDELGLSNPVIAADSVQVEAFDFVDVGELVHSSGAVPVVIKSLVFDAPERAVTKETP